MAHSPRLLPGIHSPIAWAVILATLLFCPITFAQTGVAPEWKITTIETLNMQIASLRKSDRCTNELQAQHRWLTDWNPGEMKAEPMQTAGDIPLKRLEPELKSHAAIQMRATIESSISSESNDSESNSNAYCMLKRAACRHPNDAAMQQAYLHWMDDDPTRRKGFLNEIETVSTGLICLLKQSIACRPDAKCELALEFARYRRARALAYRELPSVVANHPIRDQKRLNQLIRVAFDELIRESGSGRTEFVLLEIRMLRRAGQHGRALALLEEFGPTVLPKWYQKKRRDLLHELGWIPPYQEAAMIFAKNFPEEVAKER